MKLTNYTCGLIESGEVFIFKRSNKELTCEECALRCREMFAENCKFKDTCKLFLKKWPTYKYGVFKKNGHN